MDLSKLTQEERAALKAQLEAEEKADKAREQKERDTYKELVDSAVRSNVRKLQVLSAEMERVKAEVFGEFAAIIRTKNELFRTKVNRQSDTFTTADGTMSITLGNRVNEGWDDTVEAGIAKVKEYLSTLARDENSAALVETVMGLAQGLTPAELLTAYDPATGNLWLLVLLTTALAPIAVCRKAESSEKKR